LTAGVRGHIAPRRRRRQPDEIFAAPTDVPSGRLLASAAAAQEGEPWAARHQQQNAGFANAFPYVRN